MGKACSGSALSLPPKGVRDRTQSLPPLSERVRDRRNDQVPHVSTGMYDIYSSSNARASGPCQTGGPKIWAPLPVLFARDVQARAAVPVFARFSCTRQVRLPGTMRSFSGRRPQRSHTAILGACWQRKFAGVNFELLRRVLPHGRHARGKLEARMPPRGSSTVPWQGDRGCRCARPAGHY